MRSLAAFALGYLARELVERWEQYRFEQRLEEVDDWHLAPIAPDDRGVDLEAVDGRHTYADAVRRLDELRARGDL